MYTEFVYDYLTVEKWAEHNGLELKDGQILIELAHRVYYSEHPDA